MTPKLPRRNYTITFPKILSRLNPTLKLKGGVDNKAILFYIIPKVLEQFRWRKAVYEDLEEYRGEKTQCDNPGCKRKFTEGEVITVTDTGYAFCFTDEKGGCLIAYAFSTGEVYAVNIQARRFRGSKYRELANPTPNYPNMPVADKKKHEEDSWLRKVLGGLGE